MMNHFRVLYCTALAALLASQGFVLAQEQNQFILYVVQRNGNILKIFPNGSVVPFSGVGKGYNSIDVLDDKIYIPDLEMGKVKVYSLEGKLIRYITMPEMKGFVKIIALPEDRIALLDNYLDKIFILNSYGAVLKTINLPQGVDGKRQVVDGNFVNDTLYVFDGTSGIIMRISLKNYIWGSSLDIQSKLGEEIKAVAFTSGNYYLATRNRIYNKSLKLVAELKERSIESIIVAGDYLYVAAGFGGKIYKVDVKTGEVSIYASGLDFPKDLAAPEVPTAPPSPTPAPTTLPPTTPPPSPSPTPSPSPWLPTISKSTLLLAYGLIGGGVFFLGLVAVLVRRGRGRHRRPKYPVWEQRFEEPIPIPMEELKVEVKPEEIEKSPIEKPELPERPIVPEKIREEIKPEVEKLPIEKFEEEAIERPKPLFEEIKEEKLERIGEEEVPSIPEVKEEELKRPEPIELEKVEMEEPKPPIEEPRLERPEKAPLKEVKEVRTSMLRALIEEAKKEMKAKKPKIPVTVKKEGLKVPKKPLLKEIKKIEVEKHEMTRKPSILEEIKREMEQERPKPEPALEEVKEEEKPEIPKEILLEEIKPEEMEKPEVKVEEVKEEAKPEGAEKEEAEVLGLPEKIEGLEELKPPVEEMKEEIIEFPGKPSIPEEVKEEVKLEETELLPKEELSEIEKPEELKKPSILEEVKKEVEVKRPEPVLEEVKPEEIEKPELPEKPIVPEKIREEIKPEEIKLEKEEISVESLWEYFKEKSKKGEIEKPKKVEKVKTEEKLKKPEEAVVEEEINVEDLWKYLRKKYESEKKGKKK